MRKINNQRPETPDWLDWHRRGAERTGKDTEKFRSGGKISIVDGLYKERKEDMVRAFWGKCAYCETKILHVAQEGSVEPLSQRGDVEHFRPKNAATDESFQTAFVAHEEEERAHPGYFWLAYQWENLLLACITCNQLWKDARGCTFGKSDRFPVAGIRATQSGEELHEEPLLLNPADPAYRRARHFGFDDTTGALILKTREAKMCQQILNLNRSGLVSERKRMYDAVRALIRDTCQALRDRDWDRHQGNVAILSEHMDGKHPYTTAARAALKRECPQFENMEALLR